MGVFPLHHWCSTYVAISVVPPNNNDTPEDILLRGVVRVEKAENPEQYIEGVLKRVKRQHIERTYGVKDFDTPTQFLELMARKGGRLLKGGEADADGAARMVLNDFLRGKLPWFTPPPLLGGQDERGVEGRHGVLGEMSRKRSRKDGSAEGEGVGNGEVEEDESEGEDEGADEDIQDGSHEEGEEEGEVEEDVNIQDRVSAKAMKPRSSKIGARSVKRRKKS